MEHSLGELDRSKTEDAIDMIEVEADGLYASNRLTGDDQSGCESDFVEICSL